MLPRRKHKETRHAKKASYTNKYTRRAKARVTDATKDEDARWLFGRVWATRMGNAKRT